jgi:DNA-binding MarR family transcriptional regulator
VPAILGERHPSSHRPNGLSLTLLEDGQPTIRPDTGPSILLTICYRAAMPDSPASPEIDGIPLPALLRHARSAYTISVRQELSAAGFDDLPGNGPYVLGGLVNHGGSAADLVDQLGISKQAASRLVDVLVEAGYLERGEDPDDRRRTILTATARGEAAAAATAAGVAEVDQRLARSLGAAQRTALREGLVALIGVADELRGDLADAD